MKTYFTTPKPRLTITTNILANARLAHDTISANNNCPVTETKKVQLISH